jgi:hypothetical protein
MNRPVGVTIIAVLQLIGSIFSLLIGLGVLILKDAFLKTLAESPEFQQSAQDLPPGVLGGVAIFTGVIILVASLIGFLLTYGLFTLKGWAWIVTLIFSALGILGNLSGIITGQNRGLAVFQMVISIVIVYYLLRPEVKRAFGRS